MTAATVLPDDGIIDDVAIARVMRGERHVPLTWGERLEVARRVRRAGGEVKDVRRTLRTNQDVAARLWNATAPTRALTG